MLSSLRSAAQVCYNLHSDARRTKVIVRCNPSGDSDLDRADQAWFDSDASTNAEAIREIDAEAARHGLVRTREYWLQTFTLPDGRIVRRGFCYRPEPASTGRLERVAQRRGTQVHGMSTAQMIREIRDQE
jgi:hypothetical protein